MKKFAFLLALVAVFAMSAGAFADEYSKGEFIAPVAKISDGNVKEADNENNVKISSLGSSTYTTNLYYVGTGADPLLSFDVTSAKAPGNNTVKGGISARIAAAVVNAKGSSFYVEISEDTTVHRSLDVNRIVSADVKAKLAYPLGGTRFSAPDLAALKHITVVASTDQGATVSQDQVESSDLSLLINPVSLEIGATRYAIVITSGEVLPDTVVSLDFNIQVAGANAIVGYDQGAGKDEYGVSLDTRSLMNRRQTSGDNSIEVEYSTKDRALTFRTLHADGATVPNRYVVNVRATDDTVVDETNGKKKITPAGTLSGTVLTSVQLIVPPTDTRIAEVIAGPYQNGAITCDEGKAPTSVIINTTLVDGGTSNDLTSDNEFYVMIENDNDLVELRGDLLRVTKTLRPAGVGGNFVDFEIPASMLNTLTSKAKKLYVANKTTVDSNMKITNAIPLNIGGSGGGGDDKQPLVPNADVTAETISGDVPGVAEFDKASLTANKVNVNTVRIRGVQKHSVSYSYDPDKNTVTSVSVKVGPVEAAPTGYKLAVAMRDPAPAGLYQLFPAELDAEGYLTVTVPRDCFSTGLLEEPSTFYATDVYVVRYMENGGGCEMGFGLAALVLRKRSK